MASFPRLPFPFFVVVVEPVKSSVHSPVYEPSAHINKYILYTCSARFADPRIDRSRGAICGSFGSVLIGISRRAGLARIAYLRRSVYSA